jgi:hypothetical protein
VLQSTATLQLKRFKVGSKMVIVASAPVLPNQKKNSVAKSPDSLTHPLFIYKGVQLESTLQHNKSRSPAERPPRLLRYRPAVFFRHLRLFTFSLAPAHLSKILHPSLFSFIKVRKSEGALA